MLRSIILDFDGLIIDSETPALRSWQEIFEEYETILTVERWSVCLGGSGSEFDPLAFLETELGRPIDRERLLDRRLRRKAELLRDEPLRPGVAKLLREAKERDLRIGCASSSSSLRVRRMLQEHGVLEYFDVVLGGDQVERVKPHPDLYQTMLGRLSCTKQEAVAFEDSPNGIRAAKAAGLYCIAVPNNITRALSLGTADEIVESLADIQIHHVERSLARKED